MIRLVLILIFISQLAYSQSNKDNWIRLGLFTGSIILNGIGDGLNDSGHKDYGHALNAMSLATIISIPLFIDVDKRSWYWYLGCYSAVRYGLFDASYGLAKTGNPFYQGSSGTVDHITGQIPIEVVQLSKLIIFGVGISINFNKL